MKLIIAEKPDRGLALVSQFKYRRKDGYLEVEANELFPNGAYCTWAIGHLTQLCNQSIITQSGKNGHLIRYQ